jgi:hypothetical protein
MRNATKSFAGAESLSNLLKYVDVLRRFDHRRGKTEQPEKHQPQTAP